MAWHGEGTAEATSPDGLPRLYVFTPLREGPGELTQLAAVFGDMAQTFQQRQETLQASEEHFRLLVDGVKDYVIVMLDVEGRIVGWNAGAAHLYGYRAGEIMDHRVVCFYPTAGQHQDPPSHVLDVASTTGRWEDEGWRVRMDDSWFWAHVVVTAVYDAASLLCGFALVTRDLPQSQRAQEADASGTGTRAGECRTAAQ